MEKVEEKKKESEKRRYKVEGIFKILSASSNESYDREMYCEICFIYSFCEEKYGSEKEKKKLGSMIDEEIDREKESRGEMRMLWNSKKKKKKKTTENAEELHWRTH